MRQSNMEQKLRIWLSERNQDGHREIRRYSVESMTTAKTVLVILLSELEGIREVYPNMFGLETWDESEQDWFKWEGDLGEDIRDYVIKQLEEK